MTKIVAEGMKMEVKMMLTEVFKEIIKTQRMRAEIKAIPMSLVKKFVNRATLNETIARIIK